jgi:hypothetical protein
MSGNGNVVNELCFAAEGMSGTAAATSLRKLGRLVEQAPTGRLFGAIATLADMSAMAARALEKGDRALIAGDESAAAASLGEAVVRLDSMASFAADATPEMAPAHLRRVR